eukprot:4933943-Amphidinium_carterae.1
MIQSMLRSIRSSRMISVNSVLFSQTWYWLSFIDGHIKKVVRSQIRVRRSAFIEPKCHSQDAQQSVQRESKSDQCEITIKDIHSQLNEHKFNKFAR